MAREVSRENSQAAEDKDPKAIRPDRIGKRRLNERIVDDRPDPAVEAEFGALLKKLDGIE